MAVKSQGVSSEQTKGLKKLFFKRQLVFALIILIVLGAAGVVFIYLKKDKDTGMTNKQAFTPVCSDDLLAKARPALAVGNIDNSVLQPLITEIDALSGSQEDPNCLYIKLIYYISARGAGPARDTFDKLEKVYDPEVGYNSLIWEVAASMDYLRGRVGILEESNINFGQSSKPATDEE